MDKKEIFLSKVVMMWLIYTFYMFKCIHKRGVFRHWLSVSVELNPQVGRHNHKRALLVLFRLGFDILLSVWLYLGNKSCYKHVQWCQELFITFLISRFYQLER